MELAEYGKMCCATALSTLCAWARAPPRTFKFAIAEASQRDPRRRARDQERDAMEMHQVRYFLAITRTLNFTRAAEECNVAQPSLTRAIRLLEEEFGGELFRRERPHSQLTDLGQRVLPLLQQIFDSALSARSLASSIRSGDTGSLRLALSRTIDLAILMPHIVELRKHFKNLELKLWRGTTAEVIEYMKDGEVELAVASTLEMGWERLDQWPLYTEAFELIANKGHRLASRESIAFEDLGGESLLVRSYCEHAAQLADLSRRHVPNLGQAHELNSQHDLVALLEQGFGIAFVPHSEALFGNFLRTPVKGLDLRRTVFLYGVAGRQRSAVAAMLMKMLRAADWSKLLN
jgi:DNA-binding transcriptional LysR family regulator